MSDPAQLRRHISHDQILTLIPEGSRVLDLGCGDGDLLAQLRLTRKVRGTGIDIEESSIMACTEKGLPVIQQDIDQGLRDFPDKSFDVVILSQTIQVVKNPLFVLREMLRVGSRAVVSFPNFAYLPTRLQLLFRGRMPVHKEIPYQWYNTPNIHFCTCKDFRTLCRDEGIAIIKETALRNRRPTSPVFANLRATDMCYLLAGN